MEKKIYMIKCITNLHAGSGDVNFNIVDNEVEKDPVTGYPIVHASGIKGALRDKAKEDNIADIGKIFGEIGANDTGNSGAYKFLDAHLLSRPLRVSGSDSLAFIPVTTVAAVNAFIGLLNALGCNKGLSPINVNFGGKKFLSTVAGIKIEDEDVGVLDGATASALKPILGEAFAIATSFDDYDLPVMARNCLETGKENLWYEEVVPHESVLYFAVMSPDGDTSYSVPEFVQLGGHSSIGCGFCEIREF